MWQEKLHSFIFDAKFMLLEEKKIGLSLELVNREETKQGQRRNLNLLTKNTVDMVESSKKSE